MITDLITEVKSAIAIPKNSPFTQARPPEAAPPGVLLCVYLLFFIRTRGFHKEQTDQQCDDIEHDREIQHVLVADRIDHITVGILDKASRIAHDQGCDLVAGKTRKRPRGKGDTVNRADAAHAVMVGKQGRHIGEAAAVSGIYHEYQCQHKNNQQHIAFTVLNAACEHNCAGKYNREHENQLVNRISVLQVIRPSGEAETTARIEDRRYCGDHANHACKADTFHNHLLLRDQRKTTGDIDVEHQPDAHIVADRAGFDGSHDALSLFLLLRLMPALGLRQKEMTHEHHYEINRSENPEHLINAALSQIGKKSLHDRACNRLRAAKARHRKTGRKTFLILKPKHQSLYRGQITGSETDAHDKAVADIDAHESENAAGMVSSIIYEETCASHTKGEGNRSNQGRLVNILLHHVSKESRRHA